MLLPAGSYCSGGEKPWLTTAKAIDAEALTLPTTVEWPATAERTAPKSISTGVPSARSMMLSGLMSRCCR